MRKFETKEELEKEIAALEHHVAYLDHALELFRADSDGDFASEVSYQSHLNHRDLVAEELSELKKIRFDVTRVYHIRPEQAKYYPNAQIHYTTDLEWYLPEDGVEVWKPQGDSSEET